MRSAQKSNRSRGRGNRKSGGGGNNLNRVYDSAGPEGKVRGTPQQIIDKYLSLARDAQTSGDRVTAENFLQHAEHYQRILIQATQAQEQVRRESQEAAENRAAAEQPQPAPQGQDSAGGERMGEAPVQDAGSAPQPEIGGMAMIDSGEESPVLLVGAENDDQPKAKRGNGDGRRRPRKAQEPKPAEAAPQEGPQAEAEG